MFHNIYKDKKVFVTGHTGFKGSWLCQWLALLGANVTGYALPPETKPSLFQTANIEKKINSIEGDIRDFGKLKKAIEQSSPEIVFHLAAQPIVRRSYSSPRETYEVNVMGTVNLLEALKSSKTVKAVINVTSDKCYENKEWFYGYRENDAMGGYDPYSSSKGCSELVTSAYRSSFFSVEKYGINHTVSLASARAGNVIGGGDWAEDRLIPDCVRSLSAEKTIIIRNPHATRPWQHVLEPLSGYLWLGAEMISQPKIFSQAWNFGPSDEDIWTVENVVKQVISCWGKGNYEIQGDSQLHEAKLLKLDIGKARMSLKWKPVYPAQEAIQQTTQWYYEFYSSVNFNAENAMILQIQNYEKSAKNLCLEWSCC